ncbi:1-phosphofructokinase family hexose kinase [Gordonia sp. L191]|uniref:1-phosphofructokinase family hexose kinase n=1 Tax=Gordonia sp. L191 TaxID=2982699 RepID=UPI0024C0C5AA|nr:1-phosphofructokinase family hexose kinase [Gordonia sp. L191]WHU48120.1 1-phosphofructokinase family hexose kinase [Gordonia sp. L191]
MNSPAAPHIVTVTMNPALDIHSSVPILQATEKMRCTSPRYDPGGGGINVARAAVRLGVPATAVFTRGGPTGARIEALLTAEGIATGPLDITGGSRESLTVREDRTGQEYRFVLPGPDLTATEEQQCLTALDEYAHTATHLVVSGSLPPGCSDSFFPAVPAIAERHGCTLIVDTHGPALLRVRGAAVIKPSLRELREALDLPLPDTDSQIDAARTLIARGITDAVVVSRGAAGALVVTADKVTDVAGVPVASEFGSGVGAGDNMVAGITVALARGWPLPDAVRYGAAAGAAATLTPGTEPCRRHDVDRLYRKAPGSGALE